MNSNEDILLAEACSKGIRTAQQFLYQKYAKVLFGILMRYLLNADESKDLLHDCFLKVFDKIHLYKGQGSLEGWIKRLVVNDCITYLRLKKRMRFSDISEIETSLSEEKQESAEYDLYQNLNRDDIIHCLKSLPYEYRIVFQLFALDGFSHKDIGIQLGIKENASRARYFRAKNMIKEKLMAIATKMHG